MCKLSCKSRPRHYPEFGCRWWLLNAQTHGSRQGPLREPVYQAAYKPPGRALQSRRGRFVTVVLFVYSFVWCFPEGFQK